MKVLLCPALNAVAGKIEHYVPYGLLALKAAVATYDHVDVALYSPSESLLHQKFTTSEDLAEAVLSDIEKLQFEVIGFSFVCNSAHYSISIAKRLKARNPSLRILAGGPYVTKLSAHILRAFPFIDAVFVGENRLFVCNIHCESRYTQERVARITRRPYAEMGACQRATD